MGPLSYLHNDLPKISGVWILPYCIGDRELTENAEWGVGCYRLTSNPLDQFRQMIPCRKEGVPGLLPDGV